MQIEKYRAVVLNYTARDDSGEVIDSSEVDGPIRYIHGTEDLIPGLENALEGHEQGEKLSVDVPVADAYGPRDDKLVEAVPRANFEGVSNISPGMKFQTEMDDGTPMIVTVTAVDDKHVTVDGNHPLAGKNLHFELEIVEVRDATSEEIEHGHVHEDGGSCSIH
ncbi:MAG: peptidylprolyl isomerase [Sedimenticola sp.]